MKREEIVKCWHEAHEIILTSNVPTLVHCVDGINRSSSTIIYHLMKTIKLPYQEAYNLVKKSRPIVELDGEFIKILTAINTI